MQFLSLEFGIGFLGLLVLYWAIPNRRFQNLLVLGGSGVFLGWLGVEAVAILVVSTLVDWGLAHLLQRRTERRERLAILWASIGLNIVQLAFFKYRHFYVPELESALGRNLPGLLENLVMPAGLSFWVLQKMTMVLDVYFWRSKAPKDPLDALVFAGFFPTVMSGPIERASHFLPQLATARKWNTDRFSEGVWLISIGAFQKAVIADNIGTVVDGLLNKPESGAAVVVGLFAYAIQIFGDFAGYSDMARGVARLLGFDITQNFLAPYGSPNISEFWKRWHVSLSSWLNDYVFSSCSMALRGWGIGGMVAATWVTFFVSGLWHGTGWNYVVWGSVHAIGLTVFALTKDQRKKAKKRWEKTWWLSPLAVSITFWWVCLGYLFFRAPGLSSAMDQLGLLFSSRWVWPIAAGDAAVVASCSIAVFFLHKAVYRSKDVFWIFKKGVWFRCAFYLVLGLLLLRFHAPTEKFIYFQF